MKLTVRGLQKEYYNWVSSFGMKGRNNFDIRFGQYLYNTYDLSGFKYDPFYEEDPWKVYNTLALELDYMSQGNS